MSTAAAAPRPPRVSRRDALTALVLLVLAVAPYLGTLRSAFVGDDIAVLQEDSRLVGAGAVSRFFTEPYWSGVRGDPLYRPVVQATYVLNHRLSGFRPAPYHAVNLALHALVYYPLSAWLIGGKAPWRFLGRAADAVVTVFSANSSLATVPVTLPLGVDETTRGPVVSAGGTEIEKLAVY